MSFYDKIKEKDFFRSKKLMIVCTAVIFIVIMALVVAIDRGQTIGDAREYEERILTAFNDSDFERAADCVEAYDSRYAGERSKGLPDELRSENVCAEWESRIGLTIVNKIASLDEELRNSNPSSWDSKKLTELDENIAALKTIYPTGFDYIAENGSKNYFDTEKMLSDSYLYSVKYRNSLLKMDEGDTTGAIQAMEEIANSNISDKSVINKAQSTLNSMIRSNPATDFKIVGGSANVYLISDKNYGVICPYCGYRSGAMGSSEIWVDIDKHYSGEIDSPSNLFMCASYNQGGCWQSSSYYLTINYQ